MTRTGALQRILTLGAMTAFAPMAIDMYLPGFTALQHDLHTTHCGRTGASRRVESSR